MPKKEILNNDAFTLRIAEGGAVEKVSDIMSDVADVTEQTMDILEDTIEKLEHKASQVVTITKNNPYVVAGALMFGIFIGGLITYKVTERRLSTKFDQELTEQIAAAKAYRVRVAKEGEFETPEGAVEALIPDEVVEAVQTYQGRSKSVAYNKPGTIDPRPPVEVVVENVEVKQNVTVVTENDPRDWDYNAEIADRELNPDVPYTISFAEFNENNVGHEQTTFTYYSADQTLADAQEKPVDNIDYVIGDDNLTRFGHGSDDPNVVYVRNEKIDMDFEIVRSNGSYQSEVLNVEPEPATLQHSRRHPNRRGWRADE